MLSGRPRRRGQRTWVFVGVFTSARRRRRWYLVDCDEAEIADRNAKSVASYAVDPEQVGRRGRVSSELLADG